MQDTKPNKVIKPGWFSHPNIGLLKVYIDKGTTKYCPIRKDSWGNFMAMRPMPLVPEVAAALRVVPIPPNFINDKHHMPSELKAMYHSLLSGSKEEDADEEDEEDSWPEPSLQETP